MSFRRIFIANRGEIALRIIDACDRLGIDTVLGISSADHDTLSAKRAGRALVLGGPRSTDSYLNQKAVVHAAVESGCDAVHPGYGFLSEQSSFERLCTENGLVFIGPTADQLDALGDKLSARALAEEMDVPVSPGGPTATLDRAQALADKVGYPLLVKAAFGGGGRGMKLVESDAQLSEAWGLGSSEAASAFGDGTVFVEKFVRDAKHIEVQILGDRHGNCVHLAERECSLQYRYQKVLEEAPSSSLDDDTRAKLHQYALDIANGLSYQGLGTVEFLYDIHTKDVWFLEVNPRVQVEHPVTEAVTGIDLITEQILTAAGEKLRFTQDDIKVDGHAVEMRLTAQDPVHGLRPSPGRVSKWRMPRLGGVRWDTHIYEGYLFPPFYDALMAKVIAFGGDRATALDRMSKALSTFEIDGIQTNISLLQRLLDMPEIMDNSVTTRWLEQQFTEGVLP